MKEVDCKQEKRKQIECVGMKKESFNVGSKQVKWSIRHS